MYCYKVYILPVPFCMYCYKVYALPVLFCMYCYKVYALPVSFCMYFIPLLCCLYISYIAQGFAALYKIIEHCCHVSNLHHIEILTFSV
jgi:hypothetical protein